MVKLTLLAVPGCPNAPVLEQRLAEALTGWPPVTVRRRVIADAAAAARWRMHGSPTLLVNGHDPFAEAGTGPAMACRMYRAENGGLDGAPSVAALRQALGQAFECGWSKARGTSSPRRGTGTGPGTGAAGCGPGAAGCGTGAVPGR